VLVSRRRLVVTCALAGFVALAFVPAAALAQRRIPVVATTSILADLVRQIGGERVAVTSLVGPEADAHVFSPTPADAKKLADAKLIVMNGLGLEGWLERLVRASGTTAREIAATRGVDPLHAEEGGHDHAGGDAKNGHDDQDGADPHAWQSIANAKIYVANIRDALGAVDPAGKEAYAAQAASYLTRLSALDIEIRLALGRIPQERRRIITTHDAFGYFARAYDLEFIAPQGVSTEADLSAKDIAAIVRQIRAQKIPALFLENISDPRLMEQIARESGARIGGTLYSDALSKPDGPAATYLDMMRHNLKELVAALSD